MTASLIASLGAAAAVLCTLAGVAAAFWQVWTLAAALGARRPRRVDRGEPT